MPLLSRLIVLAVLLGLLGCPRAAMAADADPVGVWPLQPEPEVVRGFAPPAVVWGSGHRGVDLLGSPGQAVHAALAGTVSFAGRLAGRGVVVVDHGATRTTYEPVTASVDRGATVGRGAEIGSLETAGSHCAPQTCLHWGWKRGEEYLDPLDLVGDGAVRLLPLWRDVPVPLVARPFVPPVPLSTFVSPYATVLAAWSSALRLAGAPAGRPGGAGPW
jgi:murein DD-endopeptidase MepM/ murein hydrolase activator NlpD